PAGAIRMEEIEVQGHRLYLPQKAVPDEQPVVPAKQDEPENRKADERVKPPGGGQVQSGAVIDLIPSGYGKRKTLPPDRISDGKHQDDKEQFYYHGIAKTQLRCNNLIETRSIIRGDDAAVEKLPNHGPHSLLRVDFCCDQQGKRD